MPDTRRGRRRAAWWRRAGQVGVGVIALWLVGRITGDRWAWSQWIFWIPTPAPLLALAVCGLIAWRLKADRRVRVVWAASLLAGITFYGGVENRWFASRADDHAGLRIVHWNPGYAKAERGYDAVERLGGDVTILTNADWAGWRRRARTWLGPDAIGARRRPFTILSRIPVLEFRHVVSADGVEIALLRLDAGEVIGRVVTLWLVDLPSDPHVPRGRYVRMARALIAAADPPPADLVIGDLNLTDGPSLRALFPEYRSAFGLAGRGHAATYPRELPLYRVDHALVGARTRVMDYVTLDPGFGRHRAQRVVVR